MGPYESIRSKINEIQGGYADESGWHRSRERNKR
jgi:hypothetical protein